MTSGSDYLQNELATQLEVLVARHANDEDVAEELIELANRAAQRKSTLPLVCRAYANAVLNLLERGELERAGATVRMGTEFASQHKLPQHVAGLAVIESNVLLARGDHAGAVRLLTETAASRHASHLSPLNRMMLYRQLVECCMLVDPSDSVDLCIALALCGWANEKRPLPIYWINFECVTRLYQWLWSAEAFKGMLHRPVLDAEQRRRLLERARVILGQGQGEPSAYHTETVALRVTELLLNALESSDPTKAHLAAELADFRAKDTLRLASHAYAVCAVLLVLGQPHAAGKLLRDAVPQDKSRLSWNVRLQLLHLESAIEEALGNLEAAMHLYRSYASEMSTRAAQLEFRTRELVKTLSQLPGARPEDTRGYFPEYLRRAVGMVSAEPCAWNVTALAHAVGVAERTLRSAFEVHFGVQPKAFILNARLERAKEYLDSRRGQQVPLADLAQQFGFSHPSRFASAFRTRFGQSPSAWQRQER